MLLAGALGALVYQQPDIVQVLVLQGLATLGIAMLFLNIWTTQDNTIYNFSVAGCDLLRSSERRRITLIGALLGTLLGLARIDLYLVPFLLVLGTLIPPIGGVILADFCYRWRGRYPALAAVRLPACNWAGLGAYALAVAVAFTSPGVAPVNGILAAAVGYVLLDFGLERLGLVRREPPPAAAGEA
jgi:cytosine permease